METTFNLRGTRGRTERFEWTVSVRDKETGDLVADATLAGWTIYLMLKQELSDPDELALFDYNTADDAQLEIADAEHRVVALTLQPEDYEVLPRWQDYLLLCEITGVTPTGDVIDLGTGTLTIELPVRRAVP